MSDTAQPITPILFTDPGDLRHAVSGAELDLVQLNPGGLEMYALSADIGEMSIDCGTINSRLRVQGSLDAKRYALGLLRPGSRATYNGVPLDSSSILLGAPGTELNGYLHELHGWTSLVIPARWIESIAHFSSDSLFLGSQAGLRSTRPDPKKLNELRESTDTMLTTYCQTLCLQGSEATASHLSLDVRNALGALLADFDLSPRKELNRTLAQYRIAQRAERYMLARASEEICIDDLCAALCVSRRYLECAFVDAFGISPARYFRVLRLHRVRRRLKNRSVSTSVTSEALSHGFNHLGLFSQQYRSLFGETPTTTLHS